MHQAYLNSRHLIGGPRFDAGAKEAPVEEAQEEQDQRRKLHGLCSSKRQRQVALENDVNCAKSQKNR